MGCYAVEDAGAYTFIDTGLPGYWRHMTGFLASRNAALSAVEAVVLTHHHPDHIGNAERLRTQADAAVLVHHDDRVAAMRRLGKPPSFPLWKLPMLQMAGHLVRNGVARTVPVAEASSFTDEEVLDVPGRPRMIHTPGHTAGNVSLSLEDRGVLMVGDTLVTIDLIAGGSGRSRTLASGTTITNERWNRLGRSSRSRLAGSCPATVFPGKGAPGGRSSWPGKAQPGQADLSGSPGLHATRTRAVLP